MMLDTTNLNNLQNKLIKIASDLGYTVYSNYYNFNKELQRHTINHTKKLITTVKNPYLVNLYDLAHELGHAYNIKNNILNTEENAWNKAYQICMENTIPTVEFDEHKNKCLATYLQSQPN